MSVSLHVNWSGSTTRSSLKDLENTSTSWGKTDVLWYVLIEIRHNCGLWCSPCHPVLEKLACSLCETFYLWQASNTSFKVSYFVAVLSSNNASDHSSHVCKLLGCVFLCKPITLWHRLGPRAAWLFFTPTHMTNHNHPLCPPPAGFYQALLTMQYKFSSRVIYLYYNMAVCNLHNCVIFSEV